MFTHCRDIAVQSYSTYVRFYVQMRIANNTWELAEVLSAYSSDIGLRNISDIFPFWKISMHWRDITDWKLLLGTHANFFVHAKYSLQCNSISCWTGSLAWFFHFGGEILIAWTQETMMTLGGTETHNFSWQCKEPHRCCHGTLAPLAMGDSGTSTVLTRYESIRLRSVRQRERTTARDPVQ